MRSWQTKNKIPWQQLNDSPYSLGKILKSQTEKLSYASRNRGSIKGLRDHFAGIKYSTDSLAWLEKFGLACRQKSNDTYWVKCC